jgi:hypothetical protein
MINSRCLPTKRSGLTGVAPWGPKEVRHASSVEFGARPASITTLLSQ